MRDSQERELDIIEAATELRALQEKVEELERDALAILSTEGRMRVTTAYVTQNTEDGFLVHVLDSNEIGLFSPKKYPTKEAAVRYAEWVVGW